ncbi:MAG: hypothetical protein JJE27_04395, partial [Thermoleophilia bacterium]|nr:hypothetical protein [Thermoleophilia bacterium]
MSTDQEQDRAAAAIADPAAAGAEAVLEGLNDSQRAAVTHLGGPLLI